jgi:hypothetical protein
MRNRRARSRPSAVPRRLPQPERQQFEVRAIALLREKLTAEPMLVRTLLDQVDPSFPVPQQSIRDASGRKRLVDCLATHLVQQLEDDRLLQLLELEGVPWQKEVSIPNSIAHDSQERHRESTLRQVNDHSRRGTASKLAPAIGLAMLVLMFVCPPWVERVEHHVQRIGSTAQRRVRTEQAIGYAQLQILRAHPDRITPLPTRSLERFEKETRGLRINYPRLITQYLIVLAIVAAMVRIDLPSTRRRTPPHSPWTARHAKSGLRIAVDAVNAVQ